MSQWQSSICPISRGNASLIHLSYAMLKKIKAEAKTKHFNQTKGPPSKHRKNQINNVYMKS